MATRAVRAATAARRKFVSGSPAASTKRTVPPATRERLPRNVNQQRQQQGQEAVSREEEKDVDDDDDDDDGDAQSSELSSVSSFSASGAELSEDEKVPRASKYFKRPASASTQLLRSKRRGVPVKRGEDAIKTEPTSKLGDIVPAVIKKEQATKRKKTKKNEPLDTTPPPHWEEMYDAVKEMRSRIPAPVDTMGCERLADGASTPKIRRFQTLISLMLSSQTKDTVNAVAMKQLRDGLPGGLCLKSILAVEPERLDELIRIVGFHNRKTEYIKKVAIIIRDTYAGEIPSTITDLCSLPGVGPKMAHLCMSAAWDNTQGIGVDVHVHRITNMWGWVATNTPEETRLALEAWLPRDRWREINHLLVGLGQSVCLPRGRKCGECSLAETGYCRGAWVGVPKARRVKKVVKVEVKEEDGGLKEEVEDEEPGEGSLVKRKPGVKREPKVKREVKIKLEGSVSPVQRKRRKVKVEVKREMKIELEGSAIPVQRKRRKVKVEAKEEEDGITIIGDIEDIIPDLRR